MADTPPSSGLIAHVEPLKPHEVEICDEDEKFRRQIHPNHLAKGQVRSLAFAPSRGKPQVISTFRHSLVGTSLWIGHATSVAFMIVIRSSMSRRARGKSASS